jgi:hypothetical protein
MSVHVSQPSDNLDATPQDTPAEEVTVEPRTEARKRRTAALKKVAGIWADRTDIPADGLQYERELRNEWR